MNAQDLTAGARQVGIVFLCLMVFGGTLIVYWIPRFSKPIIYKFRQATFVPVQGTLSKITVYESGGTVRRSTGATVARNSFSAYYVRVWAEYAFNGKPVQVEVKKFKGQHQSLQEAYNVARSIAPFQEIGLEFYRSKKIEREDDISFLKGLKTPSHLPEKAALSFKVNPHDPVETSLSDQEVPFVQTASLIGIILMYLALLSFSWFVLFHFGKWRVLSSLLVLSVVCINIVLCVVVNKHQTPDDYRLSRKPHFGVVLGPDFNYEKVKPYVEEE
jgi:hypothetical protein